MTLETVDRQSLACPKGDSHGLLRRGATVRMQAFGPASDLFHERSRLKPDCHRAKDDACRLGGHAILVAMVGQLTSGPQVDFVG